MDRFKEVTGLAETLRDLQQGGSHHHLQHQKSKGIVVFSLNPIEQWAGEDASNRGCSQEGCSKCQGLCMDAGRVRGGSRKVFSIVEPNWKPASKNP